MAQTIRTTSDLAPQPGIQATEFTATAPQTLRTGRNVVWNLTLTRASSSSSVFRWDTGRGPARMGVYGQSDLILTYANSIQYNLVSLWGILKIGAQPGGGFTSLYFKPRLSIPFDLEYPMSLINRWAFVDSAAPTQKFYNYYRDTITFTGYGTAIINGVTYPEATLLRTKSSSYFTTDTSAAPSAYGSYRVTDQLYVPGLGIPLVSVTVDSRGLPQTMRFVEEITTSTTPKAATGSIHLWPQPAKDVLNLEGDLDLSGKTLSCIGADGSMYSLFLDTQGRVSIQELPPGIYTLQVPIRARGSRMHRFMKE